MNITLWAVAVVLAIGLCGTGGAKALLDTEDLYRIGSLPDHLPITLIRLTGYAELLGAVLLVAPGWAGRLTFLTPLAAVALTVDMAAALGYHARWREWTQMSVPIVFGVGFAAVAVGRWGWL